jgi:phosphohistidine phosphatase SixA
LKPAGSAGRPLISRLPLHVCVLALGLLGCMWSRSGLVSDLAWQTLRAGGAVAVLRHARAPGAGDPPAFKLGDCATQRNLSSEGREQARRIGAQFVANGIVVGRVLSSEWCRCLETARIASAHPIEPFPPLNSFFANQDVGGTQTRAVRELIDGWRSQPGVLVLVTHQVNITALTGVFPAEGEVVVLKPKAPSGFDVMARLKP